MKKLYLLTLCTLFSTIFSRELAFHIEKAVIEYPILDEIVDDTLVQEAARKGVVHFVGFVERNIYTQTLDNAFKNYNHEQITDELHDRAYKLCKEQKQPISIETMAHLLTIDRISRKTILCKAQQTVNTTVRAYLRTQPLRNHQQIINLQEAQAVIATAFNN